MTLVAFDATATVNAGSVWPVTKPDDWCAEWISKNAMPDIRPSIVVYKDGSYIRTKGDSSWEFENDPDWLVSIDLKSVQS